MTERVTATVVYHGMGLNPKHVDRLLVGLEQGFDRVRFGGFYVTDTPERAARYANARATGIADPDAVTPQAHTAVLTLDTEEPVRWRRRPAGHPSLDQCEANLDRGRLIAVDVAECDYRNCSCHRQAARLRAAAVQS